MRSLRSKEGWLLIDSRNGVAPDGSSGVVEFATYTCSHCHAIVVINLERTREREWCWNCDHIICDQCSLSKKLGAVCVPLNKTLDILQTQAHRDLLG